MFGTSSGSIAITFMGPLGGICCWQNQPFRPSGLKKLGDAGRSLGEVFFSFGRQAVVCGPLNGEVGFPKNRLVPSGPLICNQGIRLAPPA